MIGSRLSVWATKNSVAKGGRVKHRRAGLAVPGLGHRLDAAEIAHARAAIERGVGVEPLRASGRGRAGRCGSPARGTGVKLTDDQHRGRARLAMAQPGEHRLLGIVGLDPGEAAAVAVALMQGRQLAVERG